MAHPHLTAVSTDPKRPRAIGLSEHLEFFDRDDDRRISFHESQWGLKRLGFGYLLTVPASFAINFAVSGLGLLQRRLLNPANLALPSTGYVRHPDSRFVDEEGFFNDAELSATFDRYGQKLQGQAMTLRELMRMLGARVITSRKSVLDLVLLPVGAVATVSEWGALFWVARETREGTWVLEKETIRRFYTDPKLFYDLAEHIAESRDKRRKTTRGKLRNILQDWLI